MNKTVLRALTALGAVLVLGAVNLSIAGKERIRRDGEIVYLALAPVDPRSLMQGDYMTLRFTLVQVLEDSLQRPLARPSVSSVPSESGDVSEPAGATAPAASGEAGLPPEGTVAFAPVILAANRVATLATAPGGAALKLRYRIRNGGVWLGTNAFFFQEGDAERFAAARFGEFRVDRETGEAVLVGLRDEALGKL